MISITITLISSIHQDRDRHLASATICNDGTGDVTTGNYTFRLLEADGATFSEGRVEGFERVKSVWELLRMCLSNSEKGAN